MKNNLKSIREKMKLSVEMLATKSGVDRNIIKSLENREVVILTNATIRSIAKALNSSIEEIFFSKTV